MRNLIQRGYSLIELMVALLLGSILLLGVMQVMIGSSTLGTTTSNLLANQDTAKSTLDLLGGEVRRAGYNGCIKADNGLLDIKNYPDIDRYALVPVIDSDNNIGIEFRYGIDKNVGGSTGDSLTNKDCLNKSLYYRNMIYKNCTKDGKDGICVIGNSKEGENKDLADDIIENVHFTKIIFSFFNESTKNYQIITFDGRHGNVSENMLKKLQLTEKITFVIHVTTVETGANKEKAMTKIERDYTASFKTRNL